MANVEPSALPPATIKQFYDLIYEAYCSTS